MSPYSDLRTRNKNRDIFDNNMDEIATKNFTFRRRRYELTEAIISMLYQYPLNDEDTDRPARTPACDRALELLHYSEGIDSDDLSVRNNLIDYSDYENYKDYEREVDKICTPPEDIDIMVLVDENSELSKEIRTLEVLLFDLMVDYCNDGGCVNHLFMSAGETACELLGIGDFEEYEKAAERLGFEYKPRDYGTANSRISNSDEAVKKPRLRKGLRKKGGKC